MFGFLIGLLASSYLYFELKTARQKYKKEQKENAQKLFELSILNEVSDKIGYSLINPYLFSILALSLS